MSDSALGNGDGIDHHQIPAQARRIPAKKLSTWCRCSGRYFAESPIAIEY